MKILTKYFLAFHDISNTEMPSQFQVIEHSIHAVMTHDSTNINLPSQI